MDPLVHKALMADPGASSLFRQRYVHGAMAQVLETLTPGLSYPQTFAFHACARATLPYELTGLGHLIRISAARLGIETGDAPLPMATSSSWEDVAAFATGSPLRAALVLRCFARVHGLRPDANK
jgi:hypothetical protein